MKTIKAACGWLALITITYVLFRAASAHAYQQRGYQAAGGEYALLLLPLLYMWISRTAKAVRAAFKAQTECELTKGGGTDEIQ